VITAELKTSLLRPAQGERLVCEAVVIKAGLTLSFTEAEVYAESHGQRKLVMKASATMALVLKKD
jgi:acyl-coenzyme A thioesterase PaaI-like protein